MAKLKCNDHNRRVMVIDDKSFHRNNGEVCTSRVNIANFEGPIEFVSLFGQRAEEIVNDPYDYGDGLSWPHECLHYECGTTCWLEESVWDLHLDSIPLSMD